MASGYCVQVRRRARILFFLMLASCLPVAARGQDDVRKTTSLRFVPADAGFYSASFQLKRQIEGLLESRAVARLKEIPILQLALAQARTQWENDGNPQVQMFKAMLEQPENQQLVELLKDAGSTEVFMYGDASWGEVVALVNQLNNINRQAQIEALATGQTPQEVLAKKMFEQLSPVLDKLNFPDMVFGFKLTDPSLVQPQLARLEALGGMLMAQKPEMAGRIRREQLVGGSFVTVNLDGSLLPWDEIARDVPEDQTELFEKFSAKIKEKKLTICLGVYQNYLLLSIGDTHEHLKKLDGTNSLATRPEMAPLAKLGNKPFTSISYASVDLMKHANSTQQQLNQFVDMAEQFLPQAPITAELQQELLGDLKKLRDRVGALVPEPSPVSSFAWMNDRGFEGYSYSWGGGEALQGDQRLSILDHMGGALGFVASRTKSSTEAFDMMTEMVERGVYYFESIGLPQMEPEEQEKYRKARAELTPLAKRLATAFRDMIIPSMDDGQSAIVFDAQTKSSKWHEQMPESSQPLPMIEIAIVMSVTDAELLKKGVSESVAVVREALGKLHELFPEEVPEIKVPEVKSREFPGGTVYYYPLPTELGLDKQVAPNAGLSKEFVVLSFLPKQTVRLIGKSTVPAEGPLAKGSGPLAAASYFNFAGLIDAIKPWVGFGIEIASQQENAGAQNLVAFKDPIFVVLDVLRCMQGSSSVTYREGSAAVTHFEIRIQDL